jgi:hypothetical protein
MALFAQSGFVKGKVYAVGEPLAFTSVQVIETGTGVNANNIGEFTLKLPANKPFTLLFSYVGHTPVKKEVIVKDKQILNLVVELKPTMSVTDEVEVIGKKEFRDEVSITTIDPKLARVLPTPFGDFNKLLATLPGVVSNNELSSAYSVRGGNFDENLVYVNDMEIYRPFLIRAGQQEGLSFVNPDLVSEVEFSSGGFQSRYGDKLSSVLNVKYKEPTKNTGSFSLGVLSRAAHVEGISKDKRFTYVAGVRQKTPQYLFQANKIFKGLEVQGEYLPRFTDVQSYITYDLTTEEKRKETPRQTTLGLLTSYARNRYLVRPTTRESQFGTVSNVLRFTAAFDGQETMQYDTYQSGLKLSHKYNRNWKTDATISAVATQERENIDLESGYRLCDVETDRSRNTFNQCIFERGIGTQFNYARNKLDGRIFNFLNRNYYRPDTSHFFEFGLGASREILRDGLYEWGFIDSADFVAVDTPIIASLNIDSYRLTGYAQHTYYKGKHTFHTGLRYNYWSLNKQFIWSPRFQYAYRTGGKRDLVLRTAFGRYAQPAFYREMRNYQGELNTGISAQDSWHFILGTDLKFKMYNREFKFTGEAYAKRLFDIVPYDVDNVRIRYFGQNAGNAYAIGTDLRVGGEFVKGAESWFSLGILSTKEDVTGDNRGYIRRPSDQRVTLGIFFQDHLPNNPSARVYLNTVVGTGLPFGPPKNLNQRAALVSPPYRRVDVGFSKVVTLGDKSTKVGRYFESLWLGLEILNLIGAPNVISYTWIKDVNNNRFAVPNTLSARFVNARFIASF